MSRAEFTIVPGVTKKGHVTWSVISNAYSASSEADAWNNGEALDFADVTWVDNDPSTDPVRGAAKGQRVILIRSIHVGDWVLVRYRENGSSGQEFAKVCGIRMCRSGRKQVCKVCISWGYDIRSAALDNRDVMAKAVMERSGLEDDCMVASDHFDIVGLEMVEDVVLEKPDEDGVISTMDYGFKDGVRVMVDMVEGLWLAVMDKREDEFRLKLGEVILQSSS